MTTSFSIRPPGALDRSQWGVLWRGYLDFYGADIAQDHDDLLFARLIDEGVEDLQGWVAEHDGALVGFVHIVVHGHTWRSERVTYLQDLYAAPQMRGCGLGRALIETVYHDADAHGRGTVYWMTQRSNATARTLYDRIAHPTDFMKYSRT
ncbi:GNAT family N-acetyltransferase [Rhodobacteraceae bacterium N5(2021)]|uniref:GNAT family N-acetyltransferase n=1 Tax=Gymnodinialimonas phycosphaerae TaxID=2841589 RepID=A0A975TXT4_9RHOB|nr:GNAT family N-acetyltransferase [Gymnodinialimonas phycosphaerae]MBY4892531.1 GNAT family N-acetyltransferase [Gymnodinialimonas phycosphaerae]